MTRGEVANAPEASSFRDIPVMAVDAIGLTPTFPTIREEGGAVVTPVLARTA